MRCLRDVIMGIGVFAMIFSFSSLGYTEMGHGMHKGGKIDKETCVAQIKVLRDSAAVLQTTNPTLSKGLSDLADKKAEKMQKWQEWQDQHDAKMNLLKDSVAALKTSNPVLAQELQKMTEMKPMEKEEAEE